MLDYHSILSAEKIMQGTEVACAILKWHCKFVLIIVVDNQTQSKTKYYD